VPVVERIRDATPDEVEALESLRRRSSSIWEAGRGPLAAEPDAAELPPDAIREQRVRVAVGANERLVGFSLVLPTRKRVCELDGLFVDPDFLRRGVGRSLMADVVERARGEHAKRLDVIADPRATGFYERMGFRSAGQVTTWSGPALRMRVGL
jgi:GNAT superfamily N-acetyltransferase